MRPNHRSPAVVVVAMALLCGAAAASCSPPPPQDGGTDASPGDGAVTTDGGGDAGGTDATPGDGAADGADDVPLAHGCPVLSAPQGMPGDPPMGDTYADFAAPLFTMYCVRCHSSTRTTVDQRGGAPLGLDWDQESIVRMNLPAIRSAVGVVNYMPFNPPPDLTCEQRRRLVRWIDIGAP